MDWTDQLVTFIRAVRTRNGYRRVLMRLRHESSARKIRVAFLVSELEKWKCQSVYDRLCDSPLFEPFVAVHNLTRLAGSELEVQQKELVRKLNYFRSRGMRAIDIQRCGTKQTSEIGDMGADILFYQQPWDLPKQLRPWRVAKHALTFYIPYYTPNSMDPITEIGHKMHHFLFAQMVCNDVTAQEYKRLQRDVGGSYTTEYLPFGHPTLDEIKREDHAHGGGDLVIYAPHFSIVYGNHVPHLRFATFLWNGQAILDYAKRHPEVRWVFKPHPSLKRELVASGAMSADAVESYFKAWERIGRSCYSSPEDYLRLFAESRAMITDCGSFLTEYACTGKPIIRLVSPELNVVPHPAVARIYQTYYEAHDLGEMDSLFKMVLERGLDPQRENRLRALSESNISGGNAASRMVGFLESLIGGKSWQM